MDLAGIRQINEEVEKETLFLHDLLAEVKKTIVGQGVLIERVLVGLLGRRAYPVGRCPRIGQDSTGQDDIPGD